MPSAQSSATTTLGRRCRRAAAAPRSAARTEHHGHLRRSRRRQGPRPPRDQPGLAVLVAHQRLGHAHPAARRRRRAAVRALTAPQPGKRLGVDRREVVGVRAPLKPHSVTCPSVGGDQVALALLEVDAPTQRCICSLGAPHLDRRRSARRRTSGSASSVTCSPSIAVTVAVEGDAGAWPAPRRCGTMHLAAVGGRRAPSSVGDAGSRAGSAARPAAPVPSPVVARGQREHARRRRSRSTAAAATSQVSGPRLRVPVSRVSVVSSVAHDVLQESGHPCGRPAGGRRPGRPRAARAQLRRRLVVGHGSSPLSTPHVRHAAVDLSQLVPQLLAGPVQPDARGVGGDVEDGRDLGRRQLLPAPTGGAARRRRGRSAASASARSPSRSSGAGATSGGRVDGRRSWRPPAAAGGPTARRCAGSCGRRRTPTAAARPAVVARASRPAGSRRDVLGGGRVGTTGRNRRSGSISPAGRDGRRLVDGASHVRHGPRTRRVPTHRRAEQRRSGPRDGAAARVRGAVVLEQWAAWTQKSMPPMPPDGSPPMGGRLLRLVGDDGLGGEEERRDGGGVLQRASGSPWRGR